MNDLLAEPASPRLQELWFNFLPGRFMQARGESAEGNIWAFNETYQTILRTLPKTDLTQDEQQEMIDEANKLRATCYSIRIGEELASRYRYLEHTSPIEQYTNILEMLENLEIIIEFNSEIKIIARSRYDDENRIYEETTAAALKVKLEEINRNLFAKFENILNEWLEGAERYAGQMNFENVFYDIGLRYRTLEIGFDEAWKYAELLRIDISTDIEYIRKLAKDTLGYGPHELH